MKYSLLEFFRKLFQNNANCLISKGAQVCKAHFYRHIINSQHKQLGFVTKGKLFTKYQIGSKAMFLFLTFLTYYCLLLCCFS